MTEKQLIEGCKKQQANIQKEVFLRYKDAMFTLAVRLTGSFEDAQDILQESFIDVFQQIHSFREESTLGAWMKKIVSRKAYKKYRKTIVLEPLQDINENEIIDWGDSLDVSHLETAIKMLPDGYRMVLVMAEIEGYKHREIAEILGINEGTSKSQLFQAKKRLKELLKY